LVQTKAEAKLVGPLGPLGLLGGPSGPTPRSPRQTKAEAKLSANEGQGEA